MRPGQVVGMITGMVEEVEEEEDLEAMPEIMEGAVRGCQWTQGTGFERAGSAACPMRASRVFKSMGGVGGICSHRDGGVHSLYTLVERQCI
jgi:hypothetical protein